LWIFHLYVAALSATCIYIISLWSRYLYVVSHNSNSMIYIDTVKPVHAVTFFLFCHNFTWIESQLRGHLSLSLSQKWPFNTDLTVYVYCMVVRYTTTYAISTYHHWRCWFDSRLWRGVLDTTIYIKVIKDSAPSVVIGTDYIGSCISFYHMITSTTVQNCVDQILKSK
jgi:hypothetical protein